jgi:hypothetical protein
MVSGGDGCGWGGWIDDKYWRRLGYPWQGMGAIGVFVNAATVPTQDVNHRQVRPTGAHTQVPLLLGSASVTRYLKSGPHRRRHALFTTRNRQL